MKNRHQIALNTPSTKADYSGLSRDELLDVIVDRDKVAAAKDEALKHIEKRVRLLEDLLRLEKVKRFARSSEKMTQQECLFSDEELKDCLASNDEKDLLEEAQSEEPKKKKRKPGSGRKPLSKSIPREQVKLELSEQERAGAASTFFTVVKEELDITPAKVKVIEYMQEKAILINDGKRSVVAAQMPKHPLKGAIGSIGLLCFIIISKFCDGLPLNRLEKILSRYGGSVTRATMASWLIRLSIQLTPLMNLMREHQNNAKYIQMDETEIRVLKETDKSPWSKKYMWVTLGGPPDKKCVLFEYDPSRGKEVPLRLLEDFRGKLQTDGYASYNECCKKYELIRLGCWDHARRKFYEAFKAVPIHARYRTHACAALKLIRKLYRVEDEIKEMTAIERYEIRQKKSVPTLNRLKKWLDENMPKVDKKSPTYSAMLYTNNQWQYLVEFCNDGNAHASNILAENAIRPLACGRKAWLFADTPAGARATATYFSLVESAKLNNLDPNKYIRYVIEKLAYSESVEDIEALLPWNVNCA